MLCGRRICKDTTFPPQISFCPLAFSSLPSISQAFSAPEAGVMVDKGLSLVFCDHARWEQGLSPGEEFSPPQTRCGEGVGGEQVGL